MQEVKSSNISHVGYSGTTLTIQFKSGAKWSYHDVPAHVHRDLMASDSVGGYFGSFIKNKFKGTRHEGN